MIDWPRPTSSSSAPRSYSISLTGPGRSRRGRSRTWVSTGVSSTPSSIKDRALFSVYKHASERPLYVIEKNPKLRARQGQYLVTTQEGRVLKRGHDLETVLRVLQLAVVR